ncbi:MAG TPA: DUF167 domain-containing protein [Gemmatimonadaceae bacterium]|nr:DUF167 domain-containing protein [Gemmatimonadaceae bacterium]
MSGFDAHQRGKAIRFSVHLQPRASKNEIAGLHGGSLKVRVTAPPVEGLANEALIDFLSQSLDIPRRSVCIVSGLSSRNKVVEASEVDLEAVQRLAE